jgi:GWxTD domain-containing protein
MAIRRVSFRLLLPVALAFMSAADAAGQSRRERASTPPDSYLLAQRSLQSGDTADAIQRLRRAVRENARFGPAHLLLGAVLTDQSSEVERAFATRMEAERHLMQALRLLGPDPEVIAAFGVLMQKQGYTVDARRVLDRALREVERSGRGAGNERLATVHYALARLHESWWQPDEGERFLRTPAFEAAASCLEPATGDITAAPMDCPSRFWDAVASGASLDHLRADVRAGTFKHLRTALRYDPAHLGAAVRLLGHLTVAREWEEQARTARQLTLVLPDDPTGYLWQAVGLHLRGQSQAADSAFSLALARMPPAERALYEDVEALLPHAARREYEAADDGKRAEIARVFFTAKDPLYLTGFNERRLEHLARVALADFRFGEPRHGVRGRDTERADIWIRYGRPARMLGLTWIYGPQGPIFSFERLVGRSIPRHTGSSKMLEEGLRRSRPEAYQPATITEFLALPHQTAVFRGAEAGGLVFEVHGLVDAPRLLPTPDTTEAAESLAGELEAGLFLFDEVYQPLWSSKGSFWSTGGRPVGLTYRVDLAPGAYRYGLEARLAGPDSVPRPAARARHEIDVPDLWGGLAVSDLLLAETITPKRDEPARRADLGIVPRRSVQVAVADPLFIYFEVYGLATDAGGAARYEAELVVEDAARRNVAQRALRGLRRVAGGAPSEPRLRWERTAAPADGAVIEYLRVELSDPTPGEYVMRLTITDRATGQRAERVRWLQLMP